MKIGDLVKIEDKCGVILEIYDKPQTSTIIFMVIHWNDGKIECLQERQIEKIEVINA